jgi:saccharopine dehydrogenase (NAD+, L-lysine-forming)
MNPPTILLLGATGNTGRYLASLLLEHSEARLVLGSRSASKAAAQAEQLNLQFPGARVSSVVVDAASPDSLKTALGGVQMLAAASSTSAHVNVTARACLEAGVDYFDVQYSASKIRALHELEDEIIRAGCCFITDGGFHPGLPAALIRYAAEQFDSLHAANVGSVIKIDWKSLNVDESTVIEMASEFNDFDMRFFQNGAWKKARMDFVVDMLKMDFGEPFGIQACYPMMLEELKSLPEQIPTLVDAGFFVGSFNWFTDMVAMPLMVALVKLFPQQGLRPAGKLMHWSLNTFSSPPYGTRLKLEAGGLKNGAESQLELTLSHAEGYYFTAAPAAACLLQWMDGSIRRPGLFTQGNIVNPTRLLDDLGKMGITKNIS